MKLHKPTHLLLTVILLTVFVNKNFAQAWATRYGLDAAQYQSQFNTFMASGFYPKRLNGYCVNNSIKYSVLFEANIQHKAFIAHHGLNRAQFENDFKTLPAQGYRLADISAFNCNGADYYTGLWVKNTPATGWYVRYLIPVSSYQAIFNTYKQQGYKPVKVCGYMANGQECIAALFLKDDLSTPWASFHTLNTTDFEARNKQLSAQGYMPVQLYPYNVNGTVKFCGIYEKRAATPYAFWYNETSDNFQHVSDEYYYQNYNEIDICGYEAGGEAKYSGVWASVPQNTAAINKIDNDINGLMGKYPTMHMPGFTMAVAYDDRLIFAKSYGVSNTATGEKLRVDNRFRIGSLSKQITAYGIIHLVNDGIIRLSDHPFRDYPFLNTLSKKDVRLNNITIDNLLEHTSGFNDSVVSLGVPGPETYNNLDYSTAKTKYISSVISKVVLLYNPGQMPMYANFNYAVLGKIIELKSGRSEYPDYIKDIMAPLGIDVAKMSIIDIHNKVNEVTYYPNPYRTCDPDNLSINATEAEGAWVIDIVDHMKFLTAVDRVKKRVAPIKPNWLDSITTPSTGCTDCFAKDWYRTAGRLQHNGGLCGLETYAYMFDNGFDVLFYMNSQPDTDRTGSMEGNILAIAQQLPAIFSDYLSVNPQTDLFTGEKLAVVPKNLKAVLRK